MKKYQYLCFNLGFTRPGNNDMPSGRHVIEGTCHVAPGEYYPSPSPSHTPRSASPLPPFHFELSLFFFFLYFLFTDKDVLKVGKCCKVDPSCNTSPAHTEPDATFRTPFRGNFEKLMMTNDNFYNITYINATIKQEKKKKKKKTLD